MIRLICFELKLDGFRGLADAVNSPDAVEERQPDEAVQRRGPVRSMMVGIMLVGIAPLPPSCASTFADWFLTHMVR